MVKLCGIYIIINNINNKCYIGQSTNIKKRWNAHQSSRGAQKILSQSIKKHGISNFTFDILEELSENFLNEAEVWWIAYFRYLGFELQDSLYNFTIGGEAKPDNRGRIFSLETRKKLSDSAKNMSSDTKKKISLAKTGAGNAMFGKFGSSNPQFGKPLTDEHKAKVSAGRKGKGCGRVLSQETKDKISIAAKERYQQKRSEK